MFRCAMSARFEGKEKINTGEHGRVCRVEYPPLDRGRDRRVYGISGYLQTIVYSRRVPRCMMQL